MSRTLLTRCSITLYPPYFAEWPGLSLRPSPASSSPPSMSWRVRRCVDCCHCHEMMMDGMTWLVWGRWYTDLLNKAIFINLNIFMASVDSDPDSKMAAMVIRFPAGMCFRYGWLHHTSLKLQLGSLHLCRIWTRVPTVFMTVPRLLPPQTWHTLNKDKSSVSKTRYLASLS